MAIFGEIWIPNSSAANDTSKNLVLIRETSTRDVIMNYFFGTMFILTFLIGSTLNPLIISFHVRQKKTLGTVLFLTINIIDQVKSIYFPLVLVPQLVEARIGPYLNLSYGDWIGYVTTMLLLLGEVEIVILVVLCAVRYAGVRFPGVKKRTVTRNIVILLVVAVMFRVGIFLASLGLNWSSKPLIFNRVLQIVYSKTAESKFFRYTRNIWTGLIMTAGMLLSILTMRYLKQQSANSSSFSRQTSTRHKRGILTITLMNCFNFVLTILVFCRLIEFAINPNRLRFSFLYNVFDFIAIYAMPLAQSVFNQVSFVCASISFQRYVTSVHDSVYRRKMLRTPTFSVTHGDELDTQCQVNEAA